MFRRILKIGAFLALAIAIAAALLYQFFGLRIVVTGGGVWRPAFVEPAEARDAALERHRQDQRRADESGAGPLDEAQSAGPRSPASEPPSSAQRTSAGLNPSSAEAGRVRGPAPLDGARGGSYWPGFRGPERDGYYREVSIAGAWPSRGLAPLWKQPAGGGYASFAIARGRAFTIEQRRSQEVVAAYDVLSGRELWAHGWNGEFQEFMGGDGPRATPVWSDGVVYALGALGELRGLDETTGRLIWRVNILDDNGAANLQWGMAASPLVVGDTIIVLPGGAGGRSVVAYDRRTGARVWSALDDKQAYVAPMLATLGGVQQLLVVSASRLMGLTPDRGELLWEYPWVTDYDINAASPLVVGDNRVFISSGYSTGAAVLELARAGDRFAVRQVWRNNRMKNRFASSVLRNGFIYGFDEAIFACIDAATGELKWKGGRYGYGEVVLADAASGGRLIVLTEAGDLVLLAANPGRHEELARFSALEGKTWNHPALVGGVLLVRNLREMAAFDLRSPRVTR